MAAFEGNIEVATPDIYRLVSESTSIEKVTKALDKASDVIESISGVPFRAEDREKNPSKSDAMWLRKAVLFQTAYILEQTDILSRTGATSVSQDGLSMSLPDELAMVLAPMAKRALSNCSWTKNTTEKVATYKPNRGESILVSDNHPWSPIGSA